MTQSDLKRHPQLLTEMFRFLDMPDMLDAPGSLMHHIWNLSSLDEPTLSRLMNGDAYWPAVCSRLLALGKEVVNNCSSLSSRTSHAFQNMLYQAVLVLRHPSWQRNLDFDSDAVRLKLMSAASVIADLIVNDQLPVQNAENLDSRLNALEFLHHFIIYLSTASLMITNKSQKSGAFQPGQVVAGLCENFNSSWRLGMISKLLWTADKKAPIGKGTLLEYLFELMQDPKTSASTRNQAIKMLSSIHQIIDTAKSEGNGPTGETWAWVSSSFYFQVSVIC
jgi:hypothetical protein